MNEDYILIILAMLLLTFVLGNLWEFFTCHYKIDKWPDNNLVSVSIYRHNRHKASEYVGFTFEKSENGKWKYVKDIPEIKKRIICFAILFCFLIFVYLIFEFGPFPRILPILKIILVSAAISFVTLISDPIEAYLILKRDFRKKAKELNE